MPFLRVTFVHGPQRAAQFRSCTAKKAATAALVVATRAAVDRCGPGHVVTPLRPTGTEEGQGGGVGERDILHGEDLEDPHCPAEALPALRGSVSDPALQERVQRHTAEHRVDVLPYVQILDAPVPQGGDQLVEALFGPAP